MHASFESPIYWIEVLSSLDVSVGVAQHEATRGSPQTVDINETGQMLAELQLTVFFLSLMK